MQNDVCNSYSASMNGTCYTPEECSSRDGVASGSCAEGYGVCCISKYGISCLIVSEIWRNWPKIASLYVFKTQFSNILGQNLRICDQAILGNFPWIVHGPLYKWTTGLLIYFENFKPVGISKSHSNIICTSTKVVLILKIWKV